MTNEGLHPGGGGSTYSGGGPLPPELGKWAVRILLECFLVCFLAAITLALKLDLDTVNV